MEECRKDFEAWLRKQFSRHDSETLKEWCKRSPSDPNKYQLQFPQEQWEAFRAGWNSHCDYQTDMEEI